jgi:acyl-CoA reductase-like NAD-dependent aldehyde dehydrogenase
MTKDVLRVCIGGAWVEPIERQTMPPMTLATEDRICTVPLGTAADADRAPPRPPTGL